MSTLFLTADNTRADAADTLGVLVPKRPRISAPKFGEWLQLQRGDRSLEQIATKVRKHVEGVGLKVNRSLIQKFEQGRVPGWPLLAAFSAVYDVPIEETLRELTVALEFPGASDLLRHGRTGQQTPHQGGRADVPAEARAEIARLTTVVEDYEARFGEMQDVASRLIKLAALGSKKERAATRAESARSARDRKTG